MAQADIQRSRAVRQVSAVRWPGVRLVTSRFPTDSLRDSDFETLFICVLYSAASTRLDSTRSINNSSSSRLEMQEMAAAAVGQRKTTTTHQNTTQQN